MKFLIYDKIRVVSDNINKFVLESEILKINNYQKKTILNFINKISNKYFKFEEKKFSKRVNLFKDIVYINKEDEFIFNEFKLFIFYDKSLNKEIKQFIKNKLNDELKKHNQKIIYEYELLYYEI